MADDSGKPPVEDPLVGQTIAGRYRLDVRIGEGGMGFIYRARQLDLARDVALKMLHPHLSGEMEIKARFAREMKATTRIEHPNTVRVYEHGEHDGRLFLVMELCQGRSLEDLIQKEAPLDPSRTAWIGMQIAQALAAAHHEQIVHRDLKPENVMVLDRFGQQDVVKVLDFGLAKLGAEDDSGEESTRLTQIGVRVGTPAYMAPEYVSAFTFDHRSDLYALGVILFELSTGQPPFTGRPYEILEKAVGEPPPLPSRLAKDKVPGWLEKIILKLLCKRPADRFQTAMELFHALDRGRADQISLPSEEIPRGDLPVAEPEPTLPVSRPAEGGALAKARARKTMDDAPHAGPPRPRLTTDEPTAPDAVLQARAAPPAKIRRTATVPDDRNASVPRWAYAAAGCLMLAAITAAVGVVVAFAGAWVAMS